MRAPPFRHGHAGQEERRRAEDALPNLRLAAWPGRTAHLIFRNLPERPNLQISWRCQAVPGEVVPGEILPPYPNKKLPNRSANRSIA